MSEIDKIDQLRNTLKQSASGDLLSLLQEVDSDSTFVGNLRLVVELNRLTPGERAAFDLGASLSDSQRTLIDALREHGLV